MVIVAASSKHTIWPSLNVVLWRPLLKSVALGKPVPALPIVAKESCVKEEEEDREEAGEMKSTNLGDVEAAGKKWWGGFDVFYERWRMKLIKISRQRTWLHMCLTWEALHCQFTQLSQKLSPQPENPLNSFSSFRFYSREACHFYPEQQVQSSPEKKVVKLKELKKRKGWKKKSWPQRYKDAQLLFGLIDMKILSRVLKMERITNEQLSGARRR
ncbi:hypothetical protein CRG98_047919 [Punica granatum]|uniref:Uncharacterized protein n=1 Tax=Punica granatum TaxID=22663 RepID=A0A2I0HJ28_PUNGR|nr:hypothetical protein CRG98_047919 [Punica granatum]